MGITKINELNAPQSRCHSGVLPATPAVFYGTGVGDVDSTEWRGGELAYNTGDTRMYIQVNTSGKTASWKRFADKTTS